MILTFVDLLSNKLQMHYAKIWNIKFETTNQISILFLTFPEESFLTQIYIWISHPDSF